MKGSLTVLACFAAGCLCGLWGQFGPAVHDVSMYVLYLLMFQVGIGIGGTLLFSALASLLLSQWSVADCLAVGSGFAYYSLSSILITQFKEPTLGLQLATELGTIALLTNIFREMMALVGTPLLSKYCGRLAPVSAAGVGSMDVLLPVITRYSGRDIIPLALLHGMLVDFSVPFFVSFFCQL